AINYLEADNFGDLWLLPVVDNPAGQPAVGTITITGPATASGTLNVYIGGIREQIAVDVADTETTIAARLAAQINSDHELALTAVGAAGVVTVTSKNAGEIANNIDMGVNYLGHAGGEYPPAGVGIGFTRMAGGPANPDITAALANLSDQ